MELTDKQWTRLEPIILQSLRWKDSRSRKPRDPREVLNLNGILWVLRTGAQWKDLPGRCPAAPDLPPKIPAMDKGRVVQAYY